MVYTHCLYYYCPIQHMTVPRVIHTHANYNNTNVDRETWVQYKSRQGGMNSIPL